MADFQIVLANLLDRELEEINEAVASMPRWTVLTKMLEANMGTSKPGIVKWEGWWWRISYDGPKDEPHTMMRTVEFLGRNKPITKTKKGGK
jgi:hypothetical protein